METTGSCVVVVQEAAAVVGLETEVTWFVVIVATGAVQVHVVLATTVVAVCTTLTGIDTAGAGGRSRTVCTAGALLQQFLLAPFKFLRLTALLQLQPISFLFLQFLLCHWLPLLLLWLLLLKLLLFLLFKLLLLLFLLKLLWLLLLLLKLLWIKLLLLQLLLKLWQLLLKLWHLLTNLTAVEIKST